MIRKLVLHIIANSAGLYVVDYFIKNFCFLAETADLCPEKPEAPILAFVIGGFVLGLLNTFIKPLLKLVSLPITFLTAGLFMFIINGFLLSLLVWLVNTLDLGPKILVLGDPAWATYIYAAIVLGIFNIFTHWLVKK